MMSIVVIVLNWAGVFLFFFAVVAIIVVRASLDLILWF